MNLPLSDDQAGVLYDILNAYFNSIHDESEKADVTSHAYQLLECRKLDTEDLIKAFEAMIQRRNAK